MKMTKLLRVALVTSLLIPGVGLALDHVDVDVSSSTISVGGCPSDACYTDLMIGSDSLLFDFRRACNAKTSGTGGVQWRVPTNITSYVQDDTYNGMVYCRDAGFITNHDYSLICENLSNKTYKKTVYIALNIKWNCIDKKLEE